MPNTAERMQEEFERMERETNENNTDGREQVKLDPRPFTPPPFPDAAMPGPWGELIALWKPYTSAHPGSIVPPALVLCGVHGGEGIRIGKQRCIEYLGIVGVSSVGRKDTGLEIAIDLADRLSMRRYVYGQPNSGEGIWYELRDPEGKDPGAPDKRLCLVDTEMGGTCAAMHRPTSTVQTAMCSLWDRGTKKPLTKNDRITVTDGHFAYIGLTTPRQFARNVTFEDRESGWIQRQCIAAVGEVRQIPLSVALAPAVDEQAFAEIAGAIAVRMNEAVSRGRSWQLSREARDALDVLAPSLLDPSRPETARAGAHVMRWATLYCLTVPPEPGEGAPPGIIARSHLRAAAALWEYFDASARLVLGADNVLEKILLFASDVERLTRTELMRLFGGHITAAELNEAILRGVTDGKLRVWKLGSKKKRGRPPVFIEAL